MKCSNLLPTIAVTALLLVTVCAPASAADLSALSGNWILNEDASATLVSEVNLLKTEERDYQSEYGTADENEKPDPFGKRRFGDEDWKTRRGGLVSSASVVVRQILQSETIKLYVADRIVVSYGGKVKRLVNPNPAGRVYSATGKGVSTDAIGQTLAYIDEAAFVIETRTNSAERMSERFELTDDDALKITATLKNPEWRREVKFVRYFVRD
jgi:hypothetical protein